MIMTIDSYSFITFLFFTCFFFQPFFCSLENEILHQDHSHTIRINELLPAATCHETDYGRESLKLVHKYGPCSRINHGKFTPPTHAKIISVDNARMQYFMFWSSEAKSTKFLRDVNVKGKYEFGIMPRIGSYVVKMGFGMPEQELSFILDTTSSLTWTRCRTRQTPFTQSESFITVESTSYRAQTCDSSSCVHLAHNKGTWSPNTRGLTACGFTILTLTKRNSVKYLSKEILTVANDRFKNFVFGCSIGNNGSHHSLGSVSGLLGLKQGELSFLNQTAEKYGNIFSYCIPSTASYPGYLKFGNQNSGPYKYTRLVARDRGFYGLDIVGISVGGTRLDIEPYVFSRTTPVIDPVTEITRLPPTAYDELRKEFHKLMNYPKATDVSRLDMCYNISDHKSITIPKVSFFFEGGIEVDMDPAGILYVVSESHVCLAFSRNGDSFDMTILGNMQQKTIELVYDVGKGRIGFRLKGCS